jgi:lysophospholipase L1-like esterase
MRRVLVVAVIAAVAVLQSASAFPAAPAPLRIVVLGDSLALGTGATDPANGLTFRIYRALAAGRPGSEITNFAIGGTRASDVRRLEVGSLDPHATDLVLLIAGGNDVVRRTPPVAFERAYRGLLAAIRARVPRATVVAFGVPDVARSPLFADSRAKTEALSRADDAAVKRAAADGGAAFVDLFDYTSRDAASAEFFSSDDFHPSDAGYARLAEFALPRVAGALARRPATPAMRRR